MNSLVKVFSNFKEFYSEINGATLTGAIDVIVVEQPDGEFQCSPFHVRFGKLGVLRSREKVVDIEINGEPVDIHMKLGESGEAFFVEECQEEEVEELPDNLATSPIPTNYFPSKYTDAKSLKDQEIIDNKVKIASDDLPLPLPLPRRNSIDLSKETTKDDNEQKFENQLSDYSHRRYTDNTLERRNLSEKIKEYTTQKIRQEWAEHEEVFQFDAVEKDKDWSNSTQTESSTQTKAEIITKQPKATILNDRLELPTTTITAAASPITTIIATPFVTPLLSTPTSTLTATPAATAADANAALHHIKASKSCPDNSIINNEDDEIKMENETLQMTMTQSSASLRGVTGAADDTKGSKKKRRKKSQMKKKNSQRKSSSSSSLGSSNTPIGDNTSVNGLVIINSNNTVANINSQVVDEGDGLSISISNNSSNDEEIATASKSTATTKTDVQQHQMSPVTPTRIPDLDIHFFSDTECTTSSGNVVAPRGACRPSTPIQSDSELEISLREKGRADDDDAMTNSASWKWGELPTPEAIGQHKDGSMAASQAQRNSMLSGMFNFMKRTNKIRKHVNENGGVYLSDLEAEGMDSEMAALYFPDAGLKKNELLAVGGGSMNAAAAIEAEAALTTTTAMQTEMPKVIEDDRESGNGTSLPHSPSSMEGQKSIDSDYEDGVAGRPQEEGKYLDFVAMSLCGANNEKGLPTDEDFDRHLIKYADVCENPSLFASPNLYVRLNGKYYSWAAACPIVMTIITFQKPLSNNAIEQLMHASGHKDTQTNMNNDMKHEVDNAIQTKRSWWNWRRSPNDAQPPNLKTADKNEKLGDEKDFDQTAVATTQTTRPNSPDVSENTLSKTDSTLNAENTSAMVDNLEDLSQASTRSYEEKGKSGKNERFKKSLRLSSEAIKKLNLNEGANEIEFSVTTAYQGTSRCKCYLFRWKHSDKVVISDIDGTITKSDVLGHLLPMVGKDWAQLGVAQLFSKIEQNGYKLLYLSARAIGQSRATREYLRSIRQGDLQLPDGPLLLNPTSLISAFHREVIERKPEQFKIACLSDIRDLFPNKDPFYAGYGNRINDVWAYRAVGIPIMRIFTINTKGELKHELTQTFQSSYCSMAFIADQLFPPIKADEGSIEFSSFNYWRDPIPEIEVDISFGANAGTNNAANATSTNANNGGGGGAGGTLNNSTTAESSVPNAMTTEN